MTQRAATSRSAARVLVIDRTSHVLLLFDDRDTGRAAFWYPPGGRIEDGETPKQAARRELDEELGIKARIGRLVLRRRVAFAYRGDTFDQDEWYFVAHIDRPARLRGREFDNESAAIAAHRWSALVDLETTDQVVFPEGLADLLRTLTAHEAVAHSLTHVTDEA